MLLSISVSVLVLNMKEEVEDLISNHEEADTRMCIHLKATDDNGPGNVVVRVADTDVATLLLYHGWNSHFHVWMDIHISSRKDTCYVYKDDIRTSLGKPLWGSSPGFHTFKGLDSTPLPIKESL